MNFLQKYLARRKARKAAKNVKHNMELLNIGLTEFAKQIKKQDKEQE